jgi:hypothetical protein
VRYLEQTVLNKASVPLLRVQYDPTPSGLIRRFRDDLNEQDSAWIEVYEGVATNAPIRYFAIDTYYNRGIGKYRIVQRWTFWENGVIYARVFSAGEQWPYNHRHHLYWRFDFDISDSNNNLVLEWQGYGDYGYGDGWLPITVETARTKQVFPDRTSWAVIDKAPLGAGTLTLSGYQIIPGDNDGVADDFSRFDLAAELYHPWEDLPGTLGDKNNDHVADFINGESVDGQHVVLWYAAHLFHDISDKGRDWHEAGPTLIPVQLIATPPGGPTVKINAPDPNIGYVDDQAITFQASAYDANGNPIADANIVWTDDINGFLGTGSVLQHNLSGGVPAVHHVMVTVTSVGRTASDSVKILVAFRIT